METKKYDVLIIGGGPAGLTASVYASRASLNTVFIERDAPGGKMVKTALIENWTGDISVNGADLSLRMFNHAQAYGGEYKYGDVEKIVSHGNYDHEVILKNQTTMRTKTIIIATGMVEKVPTWIKNIEKFNNKGVSYCAICDGPLFKDQEVAVIGGGNSAVEESIYLSSIVKMVHLIVKFGFQADREVLEKMKKIPNIMIYEDSEIIELQGKEKLESIIALIQGQEKHIAVKAFFPYIGQVPISDFASHLGITNSEGYIITDEDMETVIKGIFAVGDIREKNIRQISTAVADGTIAGKIVANKIR